MTRDRASLLFILVLQVELLLQRSPRHPHLCRYYLSFQTLFTVSTRCIRSIPDIAWDSVADVVTSSLGRVANVEASQSVCLSPDQCSHIITEVV